MNESKIKFLLGKFPLTVNPVQPYSEMAMEFIAEFGASLRKDKDATKFSDVMSLAYWCRKANLENLKNNFVSKDRIGLGTVFHVTPSNVPINFMFSFLFGLLSGNVNVVRVPSKEFPQTEFLIKHLNLVLDNQKYKIIKDGTVFISYPKDNEITKELSYNCNARIIWGGDATIEDIRSCGLSPRSKEITFADRYSLAMIDSEEILKLSDEDILMLANEFYNDTFLMDQNACSSPHLILWCGKNNENAKVKFWKAVSKVTDSKYEQQPINSVDKYTKTCCDIMTYDFMRKVNTYGDNVTTVNIAELPKDIEKLRGKCGYFLEYDLADKNEINKIVNEKYQTICYFGINPEEIKDLIVKNSLRGVDRIVPIGKALNIGVIWDGYDIIGTLSRIISFN